MGVRGGRLGIWWLYCVYERFRWNGGDKGPMFVQLPIFYTYGVLTILGCINLVLSPLGDGKGRSGGSVDSADFTLLCLSVLADRNVLLGS